MVSQASVYYFILDVQNALLITHDTVLDFNIHREISCFFLYFFVWLLQLVQFHKRNQM